MCGIAGYIIREKINEKVIHEMVGSLIHRGPDSEGYYNSGGYCAGMRRLSINDLKTGDQPLFNRDRTVVLFYNGEIYNSPQLRRELEEKGYVFRTNSDGEIICHLYEEYGEDLFEKLDGMFAVSLWIEPEKKLILARDIAGEKPLYYAQISNHELVFASEVKSLINFPKLDLELNYQAIWDLPTFLWIPEPETIYKSINALLPGQILILDECGIQTKYANSNNFNNQELDPSDLSVIKETRKVVEGAIVSRLLSDVPIGSFLSSGLDSSIITAVAKKNLNDLTTFTIGFDDIPDPYHGMADESSSAEAYSKRLGTKHHTIRVTSDTFLNNLDVFCKYGDQPFAVSSGLGILSVAEEARKKGIKVLLSGDGADECFGGYSWYYHLDKLDEDSGTANEYQNISFQNFGLSLTERLEALYSLSPQVRAWAWHYYASESEKENLFSHDLRQNVSSSIRFFYKYKSSNNWRPEDFIKQDRMFYFPNEMLRKVDRMTMAYSVEGRSPFAASSVLSHANKLRYNHLVRGDVLKWVLRKAFMDILPQDICSRPKHGFNVPIDHWLKSEWAFLVEDTFSVNSELFRKGLIGNNSKSIAKMMLSDKKRLNGHSIFAYVMLNMWLENNKY
jgi:asparagine synthase (glutamine-hydrolysing)